MGVRFEASSRTEVLERLFRERAPRRLQVKLEGAAAALAERVEITTFEGKLADVVAGRRKGVEALTVLALADAGEIDSIATEQPRREAARFPDGIGLYRQAAASAAEILQLIAPLGGLAATPAADLERLVHQLEAIPDAANAVLKLVDNRRTTAEVLALSPHDLRLSARILQRLAVSEIVVPPATVTPEPIEEPPSRVVAPEPDEIEGEAVNTDVRQWLRHEEAPEPLLSKDAFTSAFTEGTSAPLPQRDREVAERVRQTVPLTTKRPSPAEEEEEFFREAGVGKTSLGTWAVLVLAGVALGIAGSLFLGGSDQEPKPDAAQLEVLPQEAITSTVATSTAAKTASVALELGPDGRPPIAGPDAPEDVKRAEGLLNAGRYSEARALLDGLRVTRATDPTVWILSGQIEVDVGRLAEAERLADRALELDGRSYRGWVLKGSVLQFRGRFAQATRAYERALRLDPKHPMTDEIQSVLEQMQKNINK